VIYWNALVFAFAATVAIGDVKWGKIPRTYTTLALLAGLAFHSFRNQFLSSFSAAAVGFLIGLAFFELGAIGGGDVKLITALGALLGFSRWTVAMEVAIFAAAGIAIVQVIRRRAVRQTILNMLSIVRGLTKNGWRAHPTINVNNQTAIRAPFGVAAALGTLVAVIRP
jgi:prepilin peptidase CpaA